MSSKSQYLKKMYEAALQGVVDDLVKAKQDGQNNRTSRDSYTTKIECLELMGICITRDALYKRVERQSKKQDTPTRPVEELSVNQNDPEVSSLSSPSTGSIGIESNTRDNDVSECMESLSNAGRPKGSTMQKKREDIKNYKECVNAIAEAYDNELTLHNPEKRLAKGYLEQLILQKKEEFGVSLFLQKQ
jgi:hypothetical protein